MLQSKVPQDANGRALGDWLAQRFSYLDAAAWRAQLAAGRVLRNGCVAAAGDALAAGDRIAWTPAVDDADDAPAVPIVHEDPDFLVVDKPPHVVAHEHSAFGGRTFVHRLPRRSGDRIAFVHRLDRQTSGLLVLSRNAEANARLQAQFAAGAVEKRYVALVHGVVAADAFTIDAPIGPAAASAVRVRRAVVAAGSRGARAAVTEVEVLARHDAHTLLAARPRTGRTHQIRVHLEHVGHPIVGDVLYGRSDVEYLAHVERLRAGGGDGAESVATGGARAVSRHLLHHERLCLAHPRTGESLTFAAAWPADLVDAVQAAARSL